MYIIAGNSKKCGSVLNGASGKIISPDMDGDGYYEANLECDWTIIVEPGYVILLIIDAFNVESGPNCSYDFLKVSISSTIVVDIN